MYGSFTESLSNPGSDPPTLRFHLSFNIIMMISAGIVISSRMKDMSRELRLVIFELFVLPY